MNLGKVRVIDKTALEKTMNHPDKPVSSSHSASGEVENAPEHAISIVVSDERGKPTGLLEKWSSEAWIYASADSLVNLN